MWVSGSDPPHTSDLSAWVFRRFSKIALEHAGISLKKGKEALVSARVAKRQRAIGLTTAKQYLRYLEEDETGVELMQFLDVITTNVTSFFRERDHLDMLHRLIDQKVSLGARRLRLWSAACSSGEEAYSMAIAALDAINGRDVDFKVLATDICTAALHQARTGVYSPDRVAPLGRLRRVRYFERVGRPGSADEAFQVRAFLKDSVVFKRLNLAKPPFPMRGPLDGVFCRNVMIYLDHTTRQSLVGEVSRLLAPDGLFAIGHSESLGNLKHCLESIGASTFTHRPTTHKALNGGQV